MIHYSSTVGRTQFCHPSVSQQNESNITPSEKPPHLAVNCIGFLPSKRIRARYPSDGFQVGQIKVTTYCFRYSYEATPSCSTNSIYYSDYVSSTPQSICKAEQLYCCSLPIGPQKKRTTLYISLKMWQARSPYVRSVDLVGYTRQSSIALKWRAPTILVVNLLILGQKVLSRFAMSGT